MTLIIGPLKNIINSNDIPVYLQNQVKRMYRNSLRMLRLINQLMDFRKIENAKMTIHAGNYDIVNFTRKILQSYGSLANQRHINMDFKKTKKL